MNRLVVWIAALAVTAFLAPSPHAAEHRTQVSIVSDCFHINGQPTYPGRTWNENKIEGLLLNSRMVQATFDDLNQETRDRWAYPDTKVWDPERNLNLRQIEIQVTTGKKACTRPFEINICFAESVLHGVHMAKHPRTSYWA